MTITEKLKITLNLCISAVTITITFYTVIELMVFLSDPNYKFQITPKGHFWINASRSLFINQLLLSIFILQHTVFALSPIKNLFLNLKMEIIQRSIYVITTSAALQLLMKYWRPIPEVVLWNVNTNLRLFWWSFVIVHVLAWMIIYVGTICMDITELLGIKHVYYHLCGLPDPSKYKSNELKRLYIHMRHPSFIGFVTILWAVPFMSLDRLLLASVLTIYMYLAWNTDRRDHDYQQYQNVKKFHELTYLK